MNYLDTIYLQMVPEDGSEDYSEVTWCGDRTNDADIEYIRTDRIPTLAQHRAEWASIINWLALKVLDGTVSSNDLDQTEEYLNMVKQYLE